MVGTARPIGVGKVLVYGSPGQMASLCRDERLWDSHKQLVFPQLFLFSTRKGWSTLGPFSRLLSRLPHTDVRTLPLCLALLLGQLQSAFSSSNCRYQPRRKEVRPLRYWGLT